MVALIDGGLRGWGMALKVGLELPLDDGLGLGLVVVGGLMLPLGECLVGDGLMEGECLMLGLGLPLGECLVGDGLMVDERLMLGLGLPLGECLFGGMA